MLDKNKMIEKVAEAICNSHPNHANDWDTIKILASQEGYMVAKNVVINTRRQAEAALKAMCAGLPIITSKDGILKRASDEMNIYNQLLSWGKDE